MINIAKVKIFNSIRISKFLFYLIIFRHWRSLTHSLRRRGLPASFARFGGGALDIVSLIFVNKMYHLIQAAKFCVYTHRVYKVFSVMSFGIYSKYPLI